MSELGVYVGMETSVAGMMAERQRMNVIAMNIANANTITKDGPYVRKDVIFEEILGGELDNLSSISQGSARPGRGVLMSQVFEDKFGEHPKVFQPGHPYADQEGFIRRPNVNLMFEMVDLQASRRAYSANLAMFRATRAMTREAINTIRSS